MEEIKTKNQTKNGTEAPKKSGFSWAKFLGLTFATVVVLISLLNLGYQVNQSLQQVKTNWAEIQFANNPTTNGIVKMARQKYESKIASVAGEIIVTDEKKPADKLVETIIDQVSPKK